MMLDHLGESHAAAAIERGIRQVLGDSGPKTPDLGGKASTRELGEAIAASVHNG
jgi:tartrate dehydrogenase/decarboxylase/D-malate dehydrogenase